MPPACPKNTPTDCGRVALKWGILADSSDGSNEPRINTNVHELAIFILCTPLLTSFIIRVYSCPFVAIFFEAAKILHS